jgi:Glycosyl transferases group 1
VKVLTLAYGGQDRPADAEQERRESADECPRTTFYERRLESDMLDDRYLAGLTGRRGALSRRLPRGTSQVWAAYRRRHDYDAVVSWGEPFGLPMAALLKATGSRTPHVGLFSWISTPLKAALLARVHTHIHRIVLWSSAQYDHAVNRLGIPPERVVRLRWLVDQRFWRPMPGPTDMFCAAGREMRDYPTLIEAIRDWPVRCHVAAKVDLRKKDQWRADLRDASSLPAHVTVAPRDVREMRALYARSRFVVVPLYPTDTDNGVTVITEAMAMGKAVICSRVQGQRDVVEEGVNGLLVPPGDARALRQAIEHLWTHPGVCEQMGRAGRARVERFHTLEQFVEGVAQAVEDAVADVRQAIPERQRSRAGVAGGTLK